jgi:2-keto-4-pentenoate hydratase/2-oxohepta-3-ene-1,7-dioic acid hydratase in catechol pathway
MKLICVGRNYAAHAEELGNSVPEEPLLFLKPDTSLMKADIFTIPPFSQNIHFECELVVQVKSTLWRATIEEANAAIDRVTLGIDFTARDMQDRLKAKGLPWEKAKAFDSSAYVSNVTEPYQLGTPILFSFKVNGELRQEGNSTLMLTGIPELLSYASTFFSIHSHDFVFTGTPAGVAAVSAGDVLEGFIGSKKYFEVLVTS